MPDGSVDFVFAKLVLLSWYGSQARTIKSILHFLPRQHSRVAGYVHNNPN